MKTYFQNQKGSAMLLALLFIVFLGIILSGLMPVVNTQLLNATNNNDALEAQYAAEAGAKRAIVGIQNGRTDWAWAISDVHNVFADGETKKYYYTTSIDPPIMDKTAPVASVSQYTITSHGYVGNAHRKVVVIVRRTGASGPLAYATFSRNNMTVNSPQINGDIYSNGHITINSHTKDTVTGTAYCAENNYTIYAQQAVGQGFKTPDKIINLDINSFMIPIPTITKSGKDLQAITNNKAGNFSLSKGSYFYNGDYGMYNQSYNIDGGNVTIYVDGNFYIGKPITGGNITIYATGSIIFNSGSVQASPGGSVNIYANNTVILNSNSSIVGDAVTVIANNQSNSYNAIEFNSGSINKTLSNSISKIYANGNVPLNNTSVIAGQGTGMLVSTGKISLNGGTAENTIFIANGNVDANNGSKVAGIYSNGTIAMNGATITYNNKAIQDLAINSGSPGFEVESWNRKN